MRIDYSKKILGLIAPNLNLKRDIWLILYTFLAIFQPPLLPIALVYLMGFVSVGWIIVHLKSKEIRRILVVSKINQMTQIFLGLFLYVLVIGLIDMMFFETRSINTTRFSTVNQIIVLTFFEFCFIWIILIQCNRRNYSLIDIFSLIIMAGLIQGLCALCAFFSPAIRSYFIMFSDKALFTNQYFLLLRGYGFSINLIDTFGYGMGLIGSYILFVRWTKSIILWIFSISIVIFTILVNARTGIVVLGIGIIINIIFKKNGIKSIVSLVSLLLFVYLSFPYIKNSLYNLTKSDNNTVSWIGNGMYQGILLINSDGSENLGAEEVSFLDNFIDLPANLFQYLFGTGHHVYDTANSLGFRTDIGYFNLIWEFGVVGSFIVLAIMAVFMIRPFFMTKDITIRKISLLNLITYFVVLMKAILIGFNPGVFVNYLATFSLYYILSQRQSSSRYLISKTHESCSINYNTGI